MVQANRIATLLVLTLLLQNVHCESDTGERSFSTSVVGMEVLLETEHQLLLTMENYANKLENKLNIIRGGFSKMWAENLKSQINPEEYLSNPINSFALISRLHQDWVNWEQLLSSSIGADDINRIEELRADMPTSIDLMEANEAIYRLNNIYAINPTDMALGLINGKQYSARFKAIDCFSIGYFMFQNDKYFTSELWLKTALQLYQDSDINALLEFDKTKILELYAKCLLKLNRSTEALDTINLALHLSPYKSKLLRLRTKSEIEFKIRKSTEIVPETIELDHKNKNQSAVKTNVSQDPCHQYAYQKLQNFKTPKLHCLYNKTTSAFLQLAPLKMEILNLDPYVVLYHDVISDAEIATLKKETRTHLHRGKTFNPFQNTSRVDKERTVQVSSLWNSTNSNISKRLDQKIADLTGFDLCDSEMIQIMNYGMGGHYANHEDFFNLSWSHQFNAEGGDRIATVLFYMSDVEQGGATVFPHIQIGVFPKKGSALLWYNLNNKGDVDERTAHTACPVIVGSKWIFTKWIRQYSQMFRRRCYE